MCTQAAFEREYKTKYFWFEILYNSKHTRIRICCAFCNLAYIIFSFASNSESFNAYLISLGLVTQPMKTEMFKLY